MGRKIRFYADEQVSKAIVQGLRQRGVDVLTAQEADMLRAPDEEHLKRAWDEGRVIFTQDDDFLRLHAVSADHAGIVYAPQQRSISRIIRGLMLVYQVLDAEDMQGQVEYL